jgi:hypothetical protein
MFRKLIATVSLASVAMVGLASVPASAQDGSYRYTETYHGDDGSYYRRETYEDRDDRGYRYEPRPSGYVRGDYYRGGYDAPPPPPRRYSDERCTSGTTGAVVGAVLGGLLGREVGRGGRWNRPSTTGMILGGGGGALAGRAIERSNC